MIIYLNSHDFPNARYSRHLRSDGTYDTSDVRVIVADMGTPVAQMAASIINNAHTHAPIPERSIWRLILNSHGNTGYIALGEGISILNVENLAALRPYFTPLSAGGHGVLIDACLVASDSAYRHYQVSSSTGIIQESTYGAFSGEARRGLQFLRAMARTLNTKVTAGIEIQFGPNGIDNSSLEGPYIRVFPDGTYQFIQQQYNRRWQHNTLLMCQ
jgi:hypothetical protein